MRRALQTVCPDALDAVVAQWLTEQGYCQTVQGVVHALHSLRKPRYARIPKATITGGDY